MAATLIAALLLAVWVSESSILPQGRPLTRPCQDNPEPCPESCDIETIYNGPPAAPCQTCRCRYAKNDVKKRFLSDPGHVSIQDPFHQGGNGCHPCATIIVQGKQMCECRHVTVETGQTLLATTPKTVILPELTADEILLFGQQHPCHVSHKLCLPACSVTISVDAHGLPCGSCLCEFGPQNLCYPEATGGCWFPCRVGLSTDFFGQLCQFCDCRVKISSLPTLASNSEELGTAAATVNTLSATGESTIAIPETSSLTKASVSKETPTTVETARSERTLGYVSKETPTTVGITKSERTLGTSQPSATDDTPVPSTRTSLTQATAPSNSLGTENFNTSDEIPVTSSTSTATPPDETSSYQMAETFMTSPMSSAIQATSPGQMLSTEKRFVAGSTSTPMAYIPDLTSAVSTPGFATEKRTTPEKILTTTNSSTTEKISTTSTDWTLATTSCYSCVYPECQAEDLQQCHAEPLCLFSLTQISRNNMRFVRRCANVSECNVASTVDFLCSGLSLDLLGLEDRGRDCAYCCRGPGCNAALNAEVDTVYVSPLA